MISDYKKILIQGLVHFFFVATLFWVPHTWAKFKTEVGLGSTNNLFLQSSNPTSDSFLWASASASKELGSWYVSLFLKGRQYAHEKSNNTLNWDFTGSHDLFESEGLLLSVDALAGQLYYPEGSSSITDTSYNNQYGGFRFSWVFEGETESPSIDLLLQGTRYPELSERLDRELSVSWNTKALSVELNFGNSTDSYYSRTFGYAGYSWLILNQDSWKSQIDLSGKFSVFPNRPLTSSINPILRRRRSIDRRDPSQEDIETQFLLQFQPSVVKIYGESEVKVAVSFSTQHSKSETANYNETSALASFKTVF